MDEKMNRNELKSEFAPDCPIRNILSRICDKWSMLVLYTLQQKPVMRWFRPSEGLCRGAAESRVLADRPGVVPLALYR